MATHNLDMQQLYRIQSKRDFSTNGIQSYNLPRKYVDTNVQKE